MTLFACAFGFVEAACVVYLRRLLHIPYGMDYRVFAASKGVALTNYSMSDMLAAQGLIGMERAREIATIVVLFAAGWAAGRSGKQRLGLFAWSFAAWDLSYYASLFLLAGFPRSLLDTDIYFLIPIDWYGPVWFPVLVVMPVLLFTGMRLSLHDQPPQGN